MPQAHVIPKLFQLRLGVLRANGSADLGHCPKIQFLPAELREQPVDLSHVLLLLLLHFGRARDLRQICHASGGDGAYLARGDECSVLAAECVRVVVQELVPGERFVRVLQLDLAELNELVVEAPGPDAPGEVDVRLGYAVRFLISVIRHLEGERPFELEVCGGVVPKRVHQPSLARS